MKKNFLLTFIVMITLLSAPAYADTISVNDTFDSALDLNVWTTSGEVAVINGQLVLGSGVTQGISTASRSFYIEPGTTQLTVSYDFSFVGVDESYFLGFDIFSDTESTVLTLAMTGGTMTLSTWTSSTGYPSGHFSQTFDVTGHGDASLEFMLNEAANLFQTLRPLDTDFYIDNLTISGVIPTDNTSPVPEPATLLLLGAGLIGMVAVSRKKQFKK
ncbi:PEP-CTERM sorting domain-containing protein [Desulfosarcina sp. OttesenSCG-928-G10]|nr:PEP-CTERM sorting domain-containing protein [Desulfosarcina sp. OttesenSCG-928-G10]